MTELLRQAVAEIEKLPPEQQDAIATRLLAELKDEQDNGKSLWDNKKRSMR
jgi:hypothetical protein